MLKRSLRRGLFLVLFAIPYPYFGLVGPEFATRGSMMPIPFPKGPLSYIPYFSLDQNIFHVGGGDVNVLLNDFFYQTWRCSTCFGEMCMIRLSGG